MDDAYALQHQQQQGSEEPADDDADDDADDMQRAAAEFLKRFEPADQADEHNKYMQALRSCSFETVPRFYHRPRSERLRDLAREASREREAFSRPRKSKPKPTRASPFAKPASEGVCRALGGNKGLASKIAQQGIAELPASAGLQTVRDRGSHSTHSLICAS